MQVKAKLIDKEWLYYLIVKENALRKPGLILLHLVEWAIQRILYRQLLLEYLRHLLIVKLKCAHDVFSTKDQVHDAGH